MKPVPLNNFRQDTFLIARAVFDEIKEKVEALVEERMKVIANAIFDELTEKFLHTVKAQAIHTKSLDERQAKVFFDGKNKSTSTILDHPTLVVNVPDRITISTGGKSSRKIEYDKMGNPIRVVEE